MEMDEGDAVIAECQIVANGITRWLHGVLARYDLAREESTEMALTMTVEGAISVVVSFLLRVLVLFAEESKYLIATGRMAEDMAFQGSR